MVDTGVGVLIEIQSGFLTDNIGFALTQLDEDGEALPFENKF